MKQCSGGMVSSFAGVYQFKCYQFQLLNLLLTYHKCCFLWTLITVITFCLCQLLMWYFCVFSGWHQCSICEKNAQYMCYTCTYSLCKGCIKDAVILCVRGNKGFCESCMKTVMLIENEDQSKKEVYFHHPYLSPSLHTPAPTPKFQVSSICFWFTLMH